MIKTHYKGKETRLQKRINKLEYMKEFHNDQMWLNMEEKFKLL